MAPKILIRPTQSEDHGKIWTILEPIIRDGETYALPRDMTQSDALQYWLAHTHQTFVAEIDGKILGTYKLGPNQLGAGSHVANCSYMTHQNARGKGIARAMCQHSLIEAEAARYKAIQFNFVIANNAAAIHLWTSLGFETIGQLPKVFDHPKEGLVDALVMFKKLN